MDPNLELQLMHCVLKNELVQIAFEVNAPFTTVSTFLMYYIALEEDDTKRVQRYSETLPVHVINEIFHTRSEWDWRQMASMKIEIMERG